MFFGSFVGFVKNCFNCFMLSEKFPKYKTFILREIFRQINRPTHFSAKSRGELRPVFWLLLLWILMSQTQQHTKFLLFLQFSVFGLFCWCSLEDSLVSAGLSLIFSVIWSSSYHANYGKSSVHSLAKEKEAHQWFGRTWHSSDFGQTDDRRAASS